MVKRFTSSSTALRAANDDAALCTPPQRSRRKELVRQPMADLDTLLATAPAGSKDAAAKQTHADQVFAALDKIADSKIDVTIDAMSPDAGDVLLKYVYKGLETPSDRTPSLLKWQAKLAEKFGVGSIVRVLSDRKTV